MRYWHPLTEEAVRQVPNHQVRRLVLLPLYPQFSVVTTGSSLKEWERNFSHRNCLSPGRGDIGTMDRAGL
jgi:ferrochelatase